MGLVVKKVTSCGEQAEVALSFAKVFDHVVPSAVNNGAPVPKTKIVLKDWLTGQNDISQVNKLLSCHGRKGVVGEVCKVVDGIKDYVDRLGNVKMHVEDGHFLCLDLLRSDFTMGGKKMKKHSTNIVRVLASGAIEQGSKVDRVDRGDDLRNERLLCGLTEVELEFEFAPNIFGRFDLGGSAGRRGNEWAWVDGSNPGDCVG